VDAVMIVKVNVELASRWLFLWLLLGLMIVVMEGRRPCCYAQPDLARVM
jgi:hypothetical protein